MNLILSFPSFFYCSILILISFKSVKNIRISCGQLSQAFFLPYGELTDNMSFLPPGVSIFTLAMLSIDRLLVISRPIRRLKTSTRITIMLAIVWILAIVVAIPDAISYHVFTAVSLFIDTLRRLRSGSEANGTNYHVEITLII